MRVLADLSNLTKVLDHYDKKMKGYFDIVSINGKNIADVMTEQVGWFSFYDQIRAELQSNVDILEYYCDQIQVRKFKELAKTESKAFNESSMLKMATDTPEYRNTRLAFLEVGERLLKADSIMKAFSQRGFTINNIVRVNEANLQGITINDYQ